MWNRNLGQTEDEILQNKFTKYVSCAVQRRMRDYCGSLSTYHKMICTLEEADMDRTVQLERRTIESLPILMRIENEYLLESVLALNEREQYILLNCALKEKNLTELSQELGLSYKGVAAVYYRAIQKVRKRMGGNNE